MRGSIRESIDIKMAIEDWKEFEKQHGITSSLFTPSYFEKDNINRIHIEGIAINIVAWALILLGYVWPYL